MEVEAKPPSRAHRHFVLLHGAGHGAWCWYKLRRLLEDAGHKVTCLDLASAGIDRSDPNTVLTFDDYNKPLVDFMSQLPEDQKIILVGHSAGGQSVTYALHKFGRKIRLAIYVAATMLREGLRTEQDIKDGVPDFSIYGDVIREWYGFGPDKPPTSGAMRGEFQRMILSQLSPKENAKNSPCRCLAKATSDALFLLAGRSGLGGQDSILASMLLRPWPAMALSGATFGGDDGSVNQVRRVFVRTAHDRALLPKKQEGGDDKEVAAE